MQIDFDYILINIFLLGMFIDAGRNIASGNRQFPGVLACVIFFSVVLGMRYGRGNDYFHYIDVFIDDLEPTQKFFTAFNKVLKFFSVSPFAIFFFYAFFFIKAGLLLVNNFKSLGKYLYPFFLIAFISFEEFCIRQAFGFSFVFLYIISLHQFFIEKTKKRLFLTFIFATIAYSIHSANIIEITLITIIYLFSFVQFPWKHLVLFYLFSKYFVPNFFDFSWLNQMLTFLSDSDSKFEHYVEASEYWFTNDAVDGIYSRNYFISILESVANCALIYLSTVILKRMDFYYENSLKNNYKLVITLFYCYFWGTCLLQMFHNLELFRRVFNPLYYFWCVPLAFIMTYKSQFLTKTEQKMLIPIWLFWGYEYFRYLFMRNGQTLFLWDI